MRTGTRKPPTSCRGGNAKRALPHTHSNTHVIASFEGVLSLSLSVSLCLSLACPCPLSSFSNIAVIAKRVWGVWGGGHLPCCHVSRVCLRVRPQGFGSSSYHRRNKKRGRTPRWRTAGLNDMHAMLFFTCAICFFAFVPAISRVASGYACCITGAAHMYTGMLYEARSQSELGKQRGPSYMHPHTGHPTPPTCDSTVCARRHRGFGIPFNSGMEKVARLA